jgi:ferredoxin-NADP reductase
MKLKLIEKKQEASDVISFIWESDEPLNWQAGQYLHYILHHEPTDDRGSDRWFTIAAPPHENPRITTRFAEKSSSFKARLKKFEVGDTIEAEGVEGDFVVSDPEKEMVFIAGGIGVTPYRSIILDLAHNQKPIKIHLLYSNRNSEIVFKDEFEEVRKTHPEFKIDYIIGDRLDESKIKTLVPDYQEKLVYISGPEAMVENLGSALKEAGLKEDHLIQDWFPGYPED